MKEIKFRALVECERLGKFWEYYGTLSMPTWLDRSVAIIHVKDLQFTGLKDKNGKDIYEGDIVLFEDGTKDEIVWNKDFQFHTKNNLDNSQCDFDETEAEVVGNIYENPELLNEKQNDKPSVATGDDSSNTDG